MSKHTYCNERNSPAWLVWAVNAGSGTSTASVTLRDTVESAWWWWGDSWTWWS